MSKKHSISFLLGSYALSVALVCLFWDKPLLLTGAFVIVSIILFIRWHAASDFMFYFVACLLGPVGELLAIASGAWSYAQPFYFIPTWLPLLWGIAALVVKNLSETLLTKPELRQN
jgi:hypothetical protein